MRRLSLLAVAACAAFAAAAAQAAPGGALRLTALEATTFPDRAFVLTLGARKALSTANVSVTENGDRVSALSVLPASAAAGTGRAVMLAIDSSNSMRGRPIRAAVEAARALVAQRNPTQKLGVVTFNDAVGVIVPLTTSGTEIDAALAAPPNLAEGTRIYDGVAAAVAHLRETGATSGSIVLLSDGTDIRSGADADEVAEAARAARVKIFAVGLRSATFDRDALETLAKETGGRFYEAASPEQLTPIYDQLGYELANEYVVKYRSLAGPEQRVTVTLRVDGVPGAARYGYTSPPLPTIVAPPYRKPLLARFWASPFSALGASLLAAGLLAFGTLTAIRPRNRSLRRRMAEFVTLPSMTEGSPGSRLTDRVFSGTEQSLARTRWWARFKANLEIAEVKIPPVQIVLWTVVATLVAMWVFWLVGGPLLAMFGLFTPLVTRFLVNRKLQKKRDLFLEQLPDNVQVISSALRAGHSLVGALSVVVDDSPEPSRSELRRVIADEQLGVPLDDALMRVARRMDCKDLEQVALVAALGRETGGNTAEVLDQVNGTIRERFELRRMVRTLTAQGRMSRWVVSLLPVGLVFAIVAINPGYLKPLVESPIGRVLIVLAALMVIAGSFVIRKIVNIKV